MPEQDIRIEGPDGNGIYGCLSANGNRRLVVHVHGLTHNGRYFLEVTSSEFFEKNGYDHYRITLYERVPDSHKLNQSSLSTNVADIQAVLSYFGAKYDEIFLTGHSLGGFAALILNPLNVKAISLWDPSTDVTRFWATGPYLKHRPERGEYSLDYGNIFVLSEALVEEIKRYPDEKCVELAKLIETPMQFVIPELRISLANPAISMENYAKAFRGPFDLTRVSGADHCFTKRGNREALFEATLKWFNKNSGLCRPLC